MAQVADYEHYKRIKLLGEGAFGKAFLAECVSDNTLCVIKQVDLSKMSDQEKKDTLREAKILESFNHPNIVKFKEVYKTKKGKLCIVMDYADGGDLAGKIKSQKGQQNFPENQILDWFTQICLALKHVHDRKIIHRDLKGQNIFLTKTDLVKLGDFGIARVLSTTRENAKTMVGTPYYLSPEIINGKAYSFKSDIWSLGVVLYEMCALKPPFDAQSLTFLAMKIVKGQYTPVPTSFSRELKNLVGTLLQVDPLKRPSVNEVLKFPIIQNRIQNFLSKSVKIQEFSHTVLHKQQFVKNNVNFNEIKSVNNEAPIPDYLLKAQKEKDAANPKPPLSNKQAPPGQNPNRPVYQPSVIKDERPKNPVNEPPQQVNRTPVVQQQVQPKNNYHYKAPQPQAQPVYEPYKGPRIVEVSKDKIPEPIDAVKAIQEQVKNIEEKVNNWNRYAAPPEPKDRFVNRPQNDPQPRRDVKPEPQVRQQNQQNQYQRPEPVRKNIDRDILGGGGGGMVFNVAPSSNKNAAAKKVVPSNNAVAKKKPTGPPQISYKQQEIEKRDNLIQQRLADAKKKQDEERVKRDKEAERKQIMENLRQEKEKEREDNRKKMMADIKNKRAGANKKGGQQVEVYDIRGNSLTDLKDEDEEETKSNSRI
jgi:NIMA (never in mitosis gene a)-related kinase